MTGSPTPPTEASPLRPLRVLSLDGGGAKGFYTLGVLKEVEALIHAELEDRGLIQRTRGGAPLAARKAEIIS